MAKVLIFCEQMVLMGSDRWPEDVSKRTSYFDASAEPTMLEAD
jgi:hypothetical protein